MSRSVSLTGISRVCHPPLCRVRFAFDLHWHSARRSGAWVYLVVRVVWLAGPGVLKPMMGLDQPCLSSNFGSRVFGGLW